jgi:hypothetical protein
MLDYIKWLLSGKPCKHTSIECIHGDEIILAGWRRSRCRNCHATFDSLPEICSVTGVMHNRKTK